MAIEIPLTQGKVALIDDEDFDLVSGFKWNVKNDKNTFYARTKIRRDGLGRRNILMHRLLLGLTDPEIKTDHRDGNGLNNTRENIRACSHAQNMRNTGAYATNTSGFKGVHWHKQRRKWQASIKVNGKRKSLGLYITPKEAYMAYCKAAIEMHGEFANFGTTPPKRWDKPSFEYIHTGAQL